MKPTTIRLDGKVEVLIILSLLLLSLVVFCGFFFVFLWRSHPISFQSILSFRYGACGLDQVSLSFYDEENRYKFIITNRVAILSRHRLAGVVVFLRLSPEYTFSTSILINFLEKVKMFRRKGV